MNLRRIDLPEVDSTNNYLRLHRADDCLLVTADRQTAGRGSGHNHWESAAGQNLVLSLLLHPRHVEAARQFVITEAMSLAVCEAMPVASTIKWPNDIYVGDRKLAGMLIENTLRGMAIEDCIVGLGLNVNQRQFLSDAPNPTSLAIATGRTYDREPLLASILHSLDAYMELTASDPQRLHRLYLARLYRKGREALYADAGGPFRATLTDVEPTGRLVLTDDAGRRRTYDFKQVQYIIHPS